VRGAALRGGFGFPLSAFGFFGYPASATEAYTAANPAITRHFRHPGPDARRVSSHSAIRLPPKPSVLRAKKMAVPIVPPPAGSRSGGTYT
jgi:hypothetical protein